MIVAKEIHRQLAVDCFNGTWELLDKPDRNPQETRRMIHMAHASRFHWGEIGTPLEFARGDWQIARVYAVLGEGANAQKYAQSCLDICLENGFGDFDLAFAYEALARAAQVCGDTAGLREYRQRAEAAGNVIAEQEDRQYFFSELNSIPIEP